MYVCLSFDKTLAWACLTVKVCSFHLYTYSFLVVVVVVIVLLLLLLLMLVFTTTCHLYHKSNAKLLLHLDARYNEKCQCLTFDNSCLLFTVHIIRLLIKQMIDNSKHYCDRSIAIVKIVKSLKLLSWNENVPADNIHITRQVEKFISFPWENAGKMTRGKYPNKDELCRC